jgi:hypothetical protein
MPATLAELRFDGRARLQGLQEARALPKGHCEAVLRANRTESAQATSRLRAQWDEDWRHYQSDIPWQEKEPWQSQVWIPMPWTAVEQATAIIQKALLDSPEVRAATPRLLARRSSGTLRSRSPRRGIAKFADATKYAYAIARGTEVSLSAVLDPTLGR